MIRLKTLFAILIGSLFAGISLNAKSLLDRYNSGNVPKLRQMKKTDLVSMYQSSSHARALEAQKRAYRSSAKANERVFSGRKEHPKYKKIPPYILYQKTFPSLK